MAILAPRQEPLEVMSLYSIGGTGSTGVSLPSGAIAGITVAGSAFLFLAIVGPFLVWLAKRRRGDDSNSSMSGVENGYLAEDGIYHPPRRLRKRSAVVEDLPSMSTKNSWIGASRRLSKRVSLPVIPSVYFPRFEMFNVEDAFPSYGHGDVVSRGRSETGHPTRDDSRRLHNSPEKHRGYVIQQNRRSSSWIDEDALHGPRVSPKRSLRKKMSWFTGHGLPRSLSRRLSIYRQHDPELAHSPTLPCTAGNQPATFVSPPRDALLEGADKMQRRSELMTDAEMKTRFYNQRPPQRGASLASDRNRIIKPVPQRIAIPPAVLSDVRYHNDTVMSATQQLAGSARVPSFDLAASTRRYSGSQPTTNTDAELQAILRRTAERLQDGNPSSRRQTMMTPGATSSKTPVQSMLVTDREPANVQEPVEPPSSPVKDTPADMELENNKIRNSQGPSQNAAPWQTHRRTRSRRMSHASLISQVSMVSESDSVLMTPSRCSSQGESQTAHSSPIRMNNNPSPSRSQHIADFCAYSPASEQSSALSTLYSVEENSPPISILQLDGHPKAATEAEATEAARDLERSDTVRRPMSRTSTAIAHEATLCALTGEDSTKKQGAGTSSEATLYDPFTTEGVSTCLTAKRISQLSQSQPPMLPTESVGSSAYVTAPSSPLKRSQTRKHVLSPPLRLAPSTKLPMPGSYDDRQSSPSPGASESGLSSVYESYQYSRQGDGSECSQQSTTGTKLTGPRPNPSPTKTGWPANRFSNTAVENHTGSRRTGSVKSPSRRWNSRSDRMVPWTGVNTQQFGSHSVMITGSSPIELDYSLDAKLPRIQLRRDLSPSPSAVSNLSGASIYSQDEDGKDKLAPLKPLPLAAVSSSRRAMRIGSAVAQLRRMDSQASNTSGYSTVTAVNAQGGAEITSPTLPALRGGGCSPGKRGVGASTRNYLALGGRPITKGTQVEGGGKEFTTDGGKSEDRQHERSRTRAEAWEGMARSRSHRVPEGETAIRRESVNRHRRKTAIDGFEQDLNRARHVLQESRGYNLQTTPEGSRKRFTAGEAMTRVAQLAREEKRASIESLGIYDEKGFLKSPSSKKHSGAI